MATFGLFVPGVVQSGTPKAVMASGSRPPYVFRNVKTETEGRDYAPDWVETPRPGKLPLKHIGGYKRPTIDVTALLWYPNEREVETDYREIVFHSRAAYGVTFSYGQHISSHRWTVEDLRNSVEMRHPTTHSATRMQVTFTLAELTSAPPFGAGPLPGVPPSAIVVGDPPPVPTGREGPRRWTWKQGDTLEKVAFQVYGDHAYWRTIADANALADPRPQRIAYGSVLVLP